MEQWITRSLAGDPSLLDLDGAVGDVRARELHPENNEAYVMRIRRGLEEDAVAREEREKRRRKVSFLLIK